MKIVKQSHEILPELEDRSLQIERNGRICYKSEHRICEGSAEKFVKFVIGKGHNSVLEEAMIHVRVESINFDHFDLLGFEVSKFIEITHTTANYLIVSGSVRAWREFFPGFEGAFTDGDIKLWVASQFPEFFYDQLTESDVREVAYLGNFCKIITDKEVIELLPDDYKKHVHLGVKFITNRAVSHELVRHRPTSPLQESQRYCRYDGKQFGGEVTFIEPTAFDLNKFVNMHGGIGDAYDCWIEAMKITEDIYLQMLELGCSPQAARLVLPNSCKTEIIMYASLKEWEHIFAMRTTKACDPSMQEIMIPLHEDFKKLYPGQFDNPQRSIG